MKSSLRFPDPKNPSKEAFLVAAWAVRQSVDPKEINAKWASKTVTIDINTGSATRTITIEIPTIVNTKNIRPNDEIVVTKRKDPLRGSGERPSKKLKATPSAN